MQNDNIIIVRVLGGLGNQLFIYAFARTLSLKFNCKVFLEKRSGFVRDPYKRKYRLDEFDIQLENNSWYSSIYYPLRSRFETISRFFFRDAMFFNENSFFDDQQLTMLSIRNSNVTYFDGYWQAHTLFQNYADIIRTELSVKKKMNIENVKMACDIEQCNSVAIHIRRKQYESKLDLGYYYRAIERMKSLMSPNISFYVFSDDIEWCRDHLSDKNEYTFVNHNNNDEISELWLMSQCKNFIIANSTFSWWSAWLSKNNDKVVIAPKNDCLLTYPSGWVVID